MPSYDFTLNGQEYRVHSIAEYVWFVCMIIQTLACWYCGVPRAIFIFHCLQCCKLGWEFAQSIACVHSRVEYMKRCMTNGFAKLGSASSLKTDRKTDRKKKGWIILAEQGANQVFTWSARLCFCSFFLVLLGGFFILTCRRRAFLATLGLSITFPGFVFCVGLILRKFLLVFGPVLAKEKIIPGTMPFRIVKTNPYIIETPGYSKISDKQRRKKKDVIENKVIVL